MMRRFSLLVVLGLAHLAMLPGSLRGALTDGLVGYWPLDALEAVDASGNGLDGIVTGEVEAVEDRAGVADGAMLFPGLADSYVDLDDADAFQITGAMTLSAWVMLDSLNANNGRIIAKSGAGGNRSWSLNIESGNSDPTFQVARDGNNNLSVSDVDPLPQDEWAHMVGVYRPGEVTEIYVNGVLKERLDEDIPDEQFSENGLPVLIGSRNQCDNCGWLGAIDDVAIWNRDLSQQEVAALYQNGIFAGAPLLQAGDADRDLDFDQLDLVQVQIAAKYLTGQPATWGEGDWDAAPGGSQEAPPQGNGLFDQLDIIAALSAGKYLTGPYAAIATGGYAGDAQTSNEDLVRVPEPGTVVLLAVALPLVWLVRRGGR